MPISEIVDIAGKELDRKIRARVYRTDPVLWAEEYLGVQLWSRQKEILYSIRDNRATAVAAGHGIGKSFCASVAACWWMSVHPVDEIYLATTAPSVAQTDVLWNNIKAFHGLAQRRYEQGLVASPMPGYITADNKWKLADGRKIGEGRKPAEETAEFSLQGTHATYLLAIGDEAVGLSQNMLNALGNIATGKRNRQLLIANPTDPTSAMAQIWNKGLSNWHTMHISVMQSPMVTKEPGFDYERADALSGWDYINEMKEQWGEDHPIYIARVLGEWAFDSGNAVFSESEIAKAVETCVIPDPESVIHLGCDIAFSQDGDYTSVYTYRAGEVWETNENGAPVRATGVKGAKIRLLDKWKGAPLSGDQPGNPASDTRIINHASGIGAQVVKIDGSGVGQGVIQPLASRDLNFDLYSIIGSTPARQDKAYINIRAEAFFELKLAMRQGTLDLDGADEEMLDQLRSIQYDTDPRERFKIQSKSDMRKAGKKSPDFADAVWYAWYDPEIDSGPKSGDVITMDVDDFEMVYEDVRGLPV